MEGEEKTWLGNWPGKESVWDEPRNWSPQGVPKPGDTCIFRSNWLASLQELDVLNEEAWRQLVLKR
ncbi:MAG: hypothetical protein ACE5FM_00040 [Methyloligellaceae bacterium]